MKYPFAIRRSGAAYFELGLALPILVFLFLALVGFGILSTQQSAIVRATSDGLAILVQGNKNNEALSEVFATTISNLEVATNATPNSFYVSAGVAQQAMGTVTQIYAGTSGLYTPSFSPRYNVQNGKFISPKPIDLQDGDTIVWYEVWFQTNARFGGLSGPGETYEARLERR